EIAAALQERMEGVVESGTPVTADFVEELVGDINEMLRAAELPQLRTGADKAAAAAGAGAGVNVNVNVNINMAADAAAHEAHAFFIDELRTALADVTAAIPALSGDD